jgi:hypothetical protein
VTNPVVQVIPSVRQWLRVKAQSLKLLAPQLALIQSPEFSATRKALGIDRHWFLIIRGFPLQKPKQSELLDALYAQLDNDEECAIAVL